jgi:hypothetical protein
MTTAYIVQADHDLSSQPSCDQTAMHLSRSLCKTHLILLLTLFCCTACVFWDHQGKRYVRIMENYLNLPSNLEIGLGLRLVRAPEAAADMGTLATTSNMPGGCLVPLQLLLVMLPSLLAHHVRTVLQLHCMCSCVYSCDGTRWLYNVMRAQAPTVPMSACQCQPSNM